MVLNEIGRYDYNDYVVIILESVDNYDGYFHYWVTLEGYGTIDSVYGVSERLVADTVWEYVKDYIDELIDDFNGV